MRIPQREWLIISVASKTSFHWNGKNVDDPMNKFLGDSNSLKEQQSHQSVAQPFLSTFLTRINRMWWWATNARHPGAFLKIGAASSESSSHHPELYLAKLRVHETSHVFVALWFVLLAMVVVLIPEPLLARAAREKLFKIWHSLTICIRIFSPSRQHGFELKTTEVQAGLTNH